MGIDFVFGEKYTMFGQSKGLTVSFDLLVPDFLFSPTRHVPLFVYLFVCLPIGYIFLGLSLALRSHDKITASHWSTLPPYHMVVVGGYIFFFFKSRNLSKKKKKKSRNLSKYFIYLFIYFLRKIMQPIKKILIKRNLKIRKWEKSRNLFLFLF